MAEQRDNSKAVLVGVGGLVTGLLLGRKTVQAAVPVDAQQEADYTALMDTLIKQLADLNIMAYPANLDTIFVNRVNCPALMTAYQGPYMAIADGFGLVVKNDPTNAINAIIYVGPTAGDCINPGSSWPLVRNEAVTYYIKNAEELWVSSTVAGANVIFTVEKRR